MVTLHKLPKITKHRKKRLGQGHGSGRGKTGGRGTKGQHARDTSLPATFSGGALALVKRLPLIRGKLRNKSFRKKKLIVNLKFLNILPKNTVVDIDSLIKFHILSKDAKDFGVKILGDGEIKIPLMIKLPVSKRAGKKIEAAGGKIELQNG